MRCRRVGLALMLLWLAVCHLPLHAGAQGQGVDAAPADPPVLAYYYIRYRPESWNSSKGDAPLLGPYSSDDLEVMLRHARWARAAGIDGFIVSWKSTDTLNSRLETLLRASHEEGLKLAIIYQGLDYEGNPRLVEQVAADMTHFADHYAQLPAFDLFAQPVILWNGIWAYSRSDIARVTQELGDRLLILATEKSPEDYARVADLVDGNAYYWSSANPDTYPGYEEKLVAMAEAVHERGGLWIAPAAPGYDATGIGGTQVVPRANGEMLARQMAAARKASPDAIGLISWNEFSENTFVEPSEGYGTQYLRILAGILAASGLADAAATFPVEPFQVEVQTVPALAGAYFRLGQGVGTTDEQGVARLEVSQTGNYALAAVPTKITHEGCRAAFQRWPDGVISPQIEVTVPAQAAVQSGFRLDCPVDLMFVNPEGRRVDARRVQSVTLLSSDGSRHELAAFESVWLPAVAVLERVRGLAPVELSYRVEAVIVDGANVVNRAQQSLHPRQSPQHSVELLLYSAQFAARDALFRFPVGERVVLQDAFGDERELRLASDGAAKVDMLARGLYRARVEGAPGFSFWVPVAVSRDQAVTLLVVSYVDVAAVSLAVLVFALLPVLLGRPAMRSAVRGRLVGFLRSRG